MNYVKYNQGLIIRPIGSQAWSMLNHYDFSEFFEYFVDISKRKILENAYVSKKIFHYLVF